MNNNMDKVKRLQDRIDETRKRVDNIDAEIKKIENEQSEFNMQLLWCRLIQSDKMVQSILDIQDKKRHIMDSYTNSKHTEECRILELEALITYIRDDPKRADRLFNHL